MPHFYYYPILYHTTIQFITIKNTKIPKLPSYHCAATQSAPECPELYWALHSLACTTYCCLEPWTSPASYAGHPPGVSHYQNCDTSCAQPYLSLAQLLKLWYKPCISLAQ
jgi:hypothetical protein